MLADAAVVGGLVGIDNLLVTDANFVEAPSK